MKDAGTVRDWLPPLSAENVKRRSINGVLMSVTRRIATQVIQLSGMLALARLLTPGDTGLVAMATAATGLAGLLAELQFGSLTVMLRKLDQRQCSDLFWLRLAFNLVAGGLLIVAAPWLEHFYGDARIGPVLCVQAAGLAIGALGAQHAALLNRNLHVEATTRIAIVSAAVTTAVAVAGALAHLGYWALVISGLCGGTASTAALWILCDWRPSRPGRAHTSHELLRQGAQLNTFNLLGYIAGWLGQVIIGRSWGSAATGLYYRAVTLNSMALSILWDPLDSVVGPALAQLRSEPDRMMRYYYRVTALLVTASLPVAFVGAALPHELIRVALGSQWDGGAEVLRYLALGIFGNVIGHSAGWVFFSVGDSRAVMRWGLVGWPAMIAATLIGSALGPVAIAAALSLTSTLLLLPCLRAAFRGTPLRIGSLLQAIAPSLAAAALAAVAALAILDLLSTQAALWRLACGAIAFGATYTTLLLTVLGQRPLFLQMLNELRSMPVADRA